jgi:DNA-binding MarR family transcriptional regulator/GNAT superfamily N-acetyltransferase
MDRGAIDQVRRFNRTVAEGIGALEERFLGRARPMGEARLLWEIGTDGADIRLLRDRLGLDSGYVSRILRSLEQQRLVRVRVNPTDRRMRRAELTKAGLTERAELDKRSDTVALKILEPLSERQRTTLLDAVEKVERLLKASMVEFALERPTSSGGRWCIEQYFEELNSRFEKGFDPKRSISADARELTPPGGALFIARLHGKPVGCGAIKLHVEEPAELKRMWVAPAVRGLGLGRRLLQRLEEHACESGATVVRLETNRSLREALALYRESGYAEVAPFNSEPYAHHWFEKRLKPRHR